MRREGRRDHGSLRWASWKQQQVAQREAQIPRERFTLTCTPSSAQHLDAKYKSAQRPRISFLECERAQHAVCERTGQACEPSSAARPCSLNACDASVDGGEARQPSCGLLDLTRPLRQPRRFRRAVEYVVVDTVEEGADLAVAGAERAAEKGIERLGLCADAERAGDVPKEGRMSCRGISGS